MQLLEPILEYSIFVFKWHRVFNVIVVYCTRYVLGMLLLDAAPAATAHARCICWKSGRFLRCRYRFVR